MWASPCRGGTPTRRDSACREGKETQALGLFAQAAEGLTLSGLDGGVGVQTRRVFAVSAEWLGGSALLEPDEFPSGKRVEIVQRVRLLLARTLLIRHGAPPALDHRGDEIGISPVP
jgi:hypothetical protein